MPLPIRTVRHYNLKAETGVQVISVTPGSPASRAGLKEGDILVAIDEDPIASINDIHRRLTKESLGRRLNVTILKDWTTLVVVSVVPAQAPD